MYRNVHADEWHAINALVCLLIKAGGASEEAAILVNSQSFPRRDGFQLHPEVHEQDKYTKNERRQARLKEE